MEEAYRRSGSEATNLNFCEPDLTGTENGLRLAKVTSLRPNSASMSDIGQKFTTVHHHHTVNQNIFDARRWEIRIGVSRLVNLGRNIKDRDVGVRTHTQASLAIHHGRISFQTASRFNRHLP